MITQILKLLDTHPWYILIAQKYFNEVASKYRKIELVVQNTYSTKYVQLIIHNKT